MIIKVINQKRNIFEKSDIVYDQDALLDSLALIVKCGGIFVFILEGKSVGKWLVLNDLVKQLKKETETGDSSISR